MTTIQSFGSTMTPVDSYTGKAAMETRILFGTLLDDLDRELPNRKEIMAPRAAALSQTPAQFARMHSFDTDLSIPLRRTLTSTSIFKADESKLAPPRLDELGTSPISL